MPCVLVVSTSIPTERKPYMLYVVGMGSLTPIQEAASLFYIRYNMAVTTPMRFRNSYGKSMGVGTGRGVYCMKTMGVWTPTRYSM